MARYSRIDDGRTAQQREVFQRLSRRPALVMNMRFEFATATSVVFGAGALRDFQPRQFGRRALVVGSRSQSRLAPLLEILERAGAGVTHFAANGEPTIELVSRGVEQARK